MARRIKNSYNRKQLSQQCHSYKSVNESRKQSILTNLFKRYIASKDDSTRESLGANCVKEVFRTKRSKGGRDGVDCEYRASMTWWQSGRGYL